MALPRTARRPFFPAFPVMAWLIIIEDEESLYGRKPRSTWEMSSL